MGDRALHALICHAGSLAHVCGPRKSVAESDQAVPAEHPSLSAVEVARRRVALAVAMERAGVRQVVLHGAERSGGAVAWFTE